MTYIFLLQNLPLILRVLCNGSPHTLVHVYYKSKQTHQYVM